jgi:septal ring factor EnvC (AmiA/AmiB activator)
MILTHKLFKTGHRYVWRRIAALMSILALAALLGGPAVYADATSDAKKEAYLKSVHAAQQHLDEVEKQLSDIQKDTISSHPELQKQEEDFRALLMSAMNTNGYNADEEMKRLTELQAELAKKDLKQEDRSKLLREFIQRKNRLGQAQRQAFSQEKIQKAQKDLQDAMVDAMKKKHPETDKLLQDLDKSQQNLDQLRASAP